MWSHLFRISLVTQKWLTGFGLSSQVIINIKSNQIRNLWNLSKIRVKTVITSGEWYNRRSSERSGEMLGEVCMSGWMSIWIRAEFEPFIGLLIATLLP